VFLALACGGAAALRPALKFRKYEGLGNDFLVVDNRGSATPLATPAEAAALCDRHFGVGGDGVIFVMPSTNADFKMTIYNADGSEPEMCGNGIRCMARCLADLGEAGTPADDGGARFVIETGAGPIVPVLRADGLVTVDMGEPILAGADVPCALAPTSGDMVVDAPLDAGGVTFAVTAVSMGNPHCVAFVDDAAAFDLATFGPPVEAHAAFPEKVNAEFVDVVDKTKCNMVVYERGCGPTLACGTGACAVAVAGALTGRLDRACEVRLPGGPLAIEWAERDNRVYMTGPAQFAFSGEAPLP